ncbi:MAG: AMP-binding protein, partial [Psychrosphaera sp.]|nr:AMP-binding protein [Psychrosphaera sp.]
MQFFDLLAKVKSHPEQQITFVGVSGSVVNRNFGEFADDVDALILKLRENHIRSGMRVGILGDNSYDWMVWDVALLTIGCISVAFPVDSFGQLADDLIKKYQLSYLAVSDALGLNTSEITRGIVPLELSSTQEWYKCAQHELSETDSHVHSMVFSSGTSGHLKGLTISSLGTENLVTLFEQAFGFEQQDSHLIFLPFAGYQQRMVYYGCLYNGAAVVTVPYLRLFHELRLRKPTFVIAPPMFFETVHKLTRRADADATKKALDTLLGGNIRCMITGMAAIKRESLDYFWDHDIALYEAYGITEAGMVAWNKPALKKIGTVGSVAEPGTVVLGEG